MSDKKIQGQRSGKVRVNAIQTMIENGKMSVATERYFRMRYGISEGPSHELGRIPMPARTARAIEGLEAMLVSRMKGDNRPTDLKREAIIEKLRRTQD